ncbi:hypothetical protein E5S69_20440 [Cupriavidus necator]|uniref:hypothetical protein n=1 Tax=Cupriavidus necator TaxID=106590 RepID=UPI00149062FA|nr:hypothetical protein [Cupriavidus necator]NOV25875.1 hypothetical protein [Cupriavidus necator]
MIAIPTNIPWRAISAAGLAAALFAAGWVTNGWRKDAEIAKLVANQAQADLAGANKAIENLSTAGAKIREAADTYADIQDMLGGKIDAIRKDLKNAKTPLPAGCRPDAQRVRNLSNAVDAAKQAAAAR